MRGRSALRPSVFCGLLLLVLLAITLVNNANPIGFSKNALFQAKLPETVLEVQGDLVWAGDQSYYNYHDGSLKRINRSGKVLWEVNLEGNLLWKGPEGVLVAQDNSLIMLDGSGAEIFRKVNMPDDLRVLWVQDKYLLLSGMLQGADYGILLYGSGSTVWQLPFEGNIISGSLHPKALFAVFNIIGYDARSRLQVVGPTGETVWEGTFQEPIYKIKAVEEGICAIAGDRACLLDYDGRPKWEHEFSGQVLRGDIGDDGSFAAVIKDHAGNLSQNIQHILIMLSSQGKEICSYSLDAPVNIVYKDRDHVYLVDDDGIMVLSQEGLLISNIKQKGIKQLTVADKNYIIANHETFSLLLESPMGR